MNMFVRLVVLGIRARLRSRVDPLGTCRTPFRVLPTDLDLLGHMNNGVYFSIFDLARVDLMQRSGLLPKFRKQGWYPVVTAETASFRRSLNPFRRFDVDTRIVGWDERHLYVEHRVTTGGNLATTAMIQVRFLSRSGERIAPERLIGLLDESPQRPELPGWVAEWSAAGYDHSRELATTQ
ncbi:acyl-CoA thioesterase FadM [Halopolyspora algeriensis]|uniref:Acyl-CoA thioesterase FadM n=1 Tax=Halopolyspora algeriensis TaxID=1500506 RepID=A0A368VHX5_9ACTN|nr:thioesterase family protein [Halopolyspora algeriensis]RCW39954.1 acyl-CoA thioesterase FadM [Halopolyspora algeriensis]TQM46609.1 acyl-CoA thioesterase FadM [Halopolyspora algeriensis]